MSEKKGHTGDASGKKARIHVENLLWRLLQCFLLCAVIALTYRQFVIERQNMKLSERFLKIEGENLWLSKMFLGLDKKVQTLWNEEDHHAYNISVQDKKVNDLDEEAVVQRIKRDTQETKETAGKLPDYLPNYDEKSENVIAVHVEARTDEDTTDEYYIEDNFLNKWQPLHCPHDGFALEEGNLIVKRAGLYYIYSQVSYLEAGVDREIPASHSVVVNQDNIFLTCFNRMVGFPPHHTCYTAGVRSLEANSIVKIRMESHGCSISLNGDGTFFGAILLEEYVSVSPMKYGFMDIFFPHESGD